MKKWAAPPVEVASFACACCCDENLQAFKAVYGFQMWLIWCLFCSMVRMFSFFTANMFIGTVLGDLYFPDRCSGSSVKNVWHASLSQWRWWVLRGDTRLFSIFITMFVAQILHFQIGLLHSCPRWNQWSTKGSKPLEVHTYGASPTYEQDFELEIIEFIDWRKRMCERNDIEKTREHGTRFVYVTLAGNEVTSSQAVEIISEACGMSGIEKTHDVIYGGYAKAAEAMSSADKKRDHGSIRQALVEMRSLVRDARMVLRTTLSHILLYGLLLSGVSLQAQVTYRNARCFIFDSDGNVQGRSETCDDSAGLWVGVLSGFLTAGLTMGKFYKTVEYSLNVHSVCRQYAEWQRTHETFINNDHGELQPKHEQVVSTNKGLFWYLLGLTIAAALFFTNFVWVTTKWCMATYRCEDHIWDVNFPLMQGCVNLTKV